MNRQFNPRASSAATMCGSCDSTMVTATIPFTLLRASTRSGWVSAAALKHKSCMDCNEIPSFFDAARALWATSVTNLMRRSDGVIDTISQLNGRSFYAGLGQGATFLHTWRAA